MTAEPRGLPGGWEERLRHIHFEERHWKSVKGSEVCRPHLAMVGDNPAQREL